MTLGRDDPRAAAPGGADEDAAFLRHLLVRDVVVPVRSSGGSRLEPTDVSLDEMRHGTDDRGRFLAAYSDAHQLARYGPPNSDWITMPAQDLLDAADRGDERVVLDPGSPEQREVPVGVATGAPPPERSVTRPSIVAPPAPPPLAAPGDVPEGLATALRAALEQLPQVERAWLVRRGDGWTIGVQQERSAALSAFDEVRNRLHAVGTEQLGTRRLLAVTDLRAPSLRAQYEALAAPLYERGARKGLLGRLFGSG